MEPNLKRADLDQIGRHAVGYGSLAVRPPYGASGDELFPDSSWLEAFVMAGYLPHFDEIELALHGIRVLWLRELREAEEQGRIDDAVDRASNAYMFREASEMLDQFAGEFDRETHPPAPAAGRRFAYALNYSSVTV
jgi:hypothetical protein